MPPKEAVYNARGYLMPPKRGPAKGSIGRTSERDKKVDLAEKDTADWVRGMAAPCTGQAIVSKMIHVLTTQYDVHDYYLVRHGEGSDCANSWLQEFLPRWGLQSRRQQTRVRTRRNDVNLREELFKAYRYAQSCLRALNPNKEEGIEYHYINSDETGLWTMNPLKVVFGREQAESREAQLSVEELGDKTSVMMTVTSHKDLQVEPLILLHRFRASHVQVLGFRGY